MLENTRTHYDRSSTSIYSISKQRIPQPSRVDKDNEGHREGPIKMT